MVKNPEPNGILRLKAGCIALQCRL